MNYKTHKAAEFESALRSLVDTEDAFGEIAQKMALHAKIFDLETQNGEISQELDYVRECHDKIKLSLRYKVGSLIIRPIEIISRK